MSYITLTVKVEEDDIKEYLSHYYSEEEIEEINIKNEAVEVVNGILSNELSDFAVIDENTLIIGDWS